MRTEPDVPTETTPTPAPLVPPSRPPRGGLMFQQPEDPPLPPSSTEGPEEGSRLPLEGEASGSGDGWQSDVSDEASEPAPTSSRASSGRSGGNPFTGSATREAITEGVLLAAGQVHDTFARTQAEVDAQLWLATEEEAERVADPLAKLAKSRGADLGSAVNPDAVHLIQAAIGLAAYVGRNVRLKLKLRAERRAVAQRVLEGQAVDVQ